MCHVTGVWVMCHTEARREKEASAKRLDAMARGPQTIASVISSLPEEELTDEVIAHHMRLMLRSNQQLFGSCVAFAPEAFRGKPRHNVYCCRGTDADDADGDGLRWNPLPYDYTQDEWFDVPMTQRRDHWSRPYFDEGGGDIWMVTYSVPFHRNSVLAGTDGGTFVPSLTTALAVALCFRFGGW
mgnify:CR=1 FL=1